MSRKWCCLQVNAFGANVLMSAICVLTVIASVDLLSTRHSRIRRPRVMKEVGAFVSPPSLLSRNLNRCHLRRRGFCATIAQARSLGNNRTKCDFEIIHFLVVYRQAKDDRNIMQVDK